MPRRARLRFPSDKTAFLVDLIRIAPGRKIRYLLKVSTYATIVACLSLYLHSGWEEIIQYWPLLVGVPVIVSIPACFLTVHREIIAEDLTVKLRFALAHDQLTHAYTRQALYDRFDRTDAGRVIAMIDVDHFKRVNDDHGHLVGDQVLRCIADRARGQIRQGDLLCRYGGEEFALLLVDTTLQEALAICDRIRTGIGDAPVQTATGPIRTTVSIGVTPVGPQEQVGPALARADDALYGAKARGRNRIDVAALPGTDRMIA